MESGSLKKMLLPLILAASSGAWFYGWAPQVQVRRTVVDISGPAIPGATRIQTIATTTGSGDSTLTAGDTETPGDKRSAIIHNHRTWRDTAGNTIYAHDGGISRFGDRYYWYGTSYAGNPTGLYGMEKPRLWNGVQCYSSDNLVHWKYEGVVLSRPERGWGNLGTSGRPHTLYNEKTKKYVMWYWFHLHHPAVFQMVATADKPTGPFKVLGPREVGTENGFASDHNVFKDDDGKAYLIYTDHGRPDQAVAPGTNGRYAIRIDTLTDDYLDTNKEGILVLEKGNEAPALVKYKGRYLVAASGLAGWGGTGNYYAVAPSPLGPWGKKKVLTPPDNTWGGQISSLLYIKESDTVMAMFDQWWITRDEHHLSPPAPGSADLNESRYVWLPLTFDPETETATISFRKEWHPFVPRGD